MPNSIKMQAEYGDDIQVVFVESQGTKKKATESFILKHKWMASTAMWTNERPLTSGNNGLPNYVLLGADGRVLAKGNHMGKDTRALIDDEIKKSGNGPEDASKEIQKAWKSFSKGKIAKALTLAEKAGEKEDFAEEAEQAIAAFERRIKGRMDAAQWSIDNGFFADADAALEVLAKDLKGTDFEADVVAKSQQLADPALKPEIDAEKALMKICDRLFEDGYDKKGKHQKAVAKFVEKFDGTKAAARGRYLLSLAPAGH